MLAPPVARGRAGRASRMAGLASRWPWVSASGASCPHIVQQYTQPIPRALPPTASLQQVIDVVNDNSARVQSLSTTRATISTPGFPSLNANIAFQRPRSFRLVAQKFIGPEVDLGSNDELLWFWMKRTQPPALFYCRHEQFAVSAARQIMPVEPEWLIEALGVVTFDPASHIEGPFAGGQRPGGDSQQVDRLRHGGLANHDHRRLARRRAGRARVRCAGRAAGLRRAEQTRARPGQRSHAAAARRNSVAAGQSRT